MSRARDIANLQSSKITADAGIDIDNINIDGTEIDLSSGDLTIDVAGDITLDADGGNILFKDGGTEFLEFEQDGGGCTIRVDASNTDLKFVGNDAGSTITALTLDMSDAGAASFNAGVDATSFFRSPNFYTGVGSQGFVNVDTNNCKIVSQSGDVHMYFTNDGSAYMYYDAAEKLKTVTGGVDVTGRIVADTLVIGKDSADTTLSGGTPPLQVIGTGSAATIACVRREANAYGPSIILAKSRNTSVGSYTIVNDDDSLGSITFIGDDGTNLDTYGATIAANVDGTPGENDLPARLTFSTTADGAASPTERIILPRLKPLPALFCINAKPNDIRAALLSTLPLMSTPVMSDNNCLYSSKLLTSGAGAPVPLTPSIKESNPSTKAVSSGVSVSTTCLFVESGIPSIFGVPLPLLSKAGDVDS